MKKYLAEYFGTMILVLIGCGTAMVVGCDSQYGSGYLLTALAFGISLIAAAYSVGNVSGCHINPAVSFALWFDGKLEIKDFGFYVLSQILGSVSGSLILWVIFMSGKVTDMTGNLGSNSLDGVSGNFGCGILVEAILTFIFVLVILGVTDERFKHGSFAGLIIGLTLSVVHILGIGFTGTGVNPARSLGPAIINAIFNGDFEPLKCVWVFIVGPLVGSVLAAVVYTRLTKE